jgi:hypothetical protein
LIALDDELRPFKPMRGSEDHLKLPISGGVFWGVLISSLPKMGEELKIGSGRVFVGPKGVLKGEVRRAGRFYTTDDQWDEHADDNDAGSGRRRNE